MQPTLEVGLSGLGLSPLRLRPLLPPAAPSAEEEQGIKALFGCARILALVNSK